MIELLLVVALIALVSAGVSLSLQDGQAAQLEREGLRLASLFDVARAQSRASGVPIVWRATPQGFEFLGATRRTDPGESLAEPRAWLTPGTEAAVLAPAGASWLVLGPEPLSPPQRLQLRLNQHTLGLSSNGLTGFVTDAVADAR